MVQQRLPIDTVKIDQSFVADLPGDPDAGAIVGAIIALAHNLGLKVIAEGVETQEQCAYLREHGCDRAQGYFFGRPQSMELSGPARAALSMAWSATRRGPNSRSMARGDPMSIPAIHRCAAMACLVMLGACAAMPDTAGPRVNDGRFDGPRRFALTPFTEMTPEQRAVVDAIMKGPRAAVGSPAAAAGATSLSSPFNVWNRRPELADRLQKVGEYIRFKSSLPPRLNEFAILITARQWNAQYEWFAHHRLAMAGGLNPAVAEDLAQGRVPANMKPDEQVVYDFSMEMHRQHGVSDATFKRAVDALGEQGVADLVAVNGYYVLVAMTVNADRTPIPNGGTPPLPVLK